VACRTVEQLEEVVETEALKRNAVEILDNAVREIPELENPPPWFQAL
jgi:hypothetical protein